MVGMDKDQLSAIAERAIKTFAQALVAFILAAKVTNIVDVDWAQAAGVAALAAVLSVCTSVASWNLGPDEGPSLVGEGQRAPEPEVVIPDEYQGE